MKNSIYKKILLRICTGIGLSTALMLTSNVHAAEKIPVLASFSILGDLVRVVGAERVSVTTLVGPNEDAHVFEPRPSDAKTLLQAKLLVTNGLGFEPWMQKLIKSTGYKGLVVLASAGVKPRTMPKESTQNHVETDPHAWQNPNNVVLYVRNIAAGLTKIDPVGASTYSANAEAYVQELLTLDQWAKAQFSAIPSEKRKVITSHDAFGYFAAHYQIKFSAAQGMSTDTEPSAKGVAQLIKQIQREKIKAVFTENMSSPKLLDQLSKDAGVRLGENLYADALSTAEKSGSTYLLMMRHNTTQLALGMRLN